MERQSFIDDEKRKVFFDSAPDGFLLCDTNFNIIEINSVGLKMFDFEKTGSEVIGKNIFDITPDLKNSSIFSRNLRVIENGKTLSREELFRHPMFGDRYLVVRTFKVGENLGYIIKDITDHKLAEKELKKDIQRLRKRIKELNEFAYVVSHDLKAPLHGIGLISEWLLTDYSDKLDEEGKKLLGLLSKRVMRMDNLIQGILEYSSLNGAKEEYTPINVNNLLTSVVDLLNPSDNIVIRIRNKIKAVTYDKTRLQQIFQNLLANAIKFMDKPQGLILIRGRDRTDHWQFSVTDNGPGIEEKFFQKIFQPFQTLTPRDEVDGNGIGLALVKKIVETHGGKIWLESQVNSGTTFFFTIPKSRE